MPVDHSEFTIIKLLDAATPRLFSEDASVFDGTQLAADAGGGVRSDEGPEESITFVFGKMGGQTFDDLAVDPNNPNVELRPMETPGPDDKVGLPAVQTDNGLLLPAVQTDHGLLLPAVRIDDGEAAIPDGTSNTVFFSERYGQAGPIGGVSVAGGDVDGATDALGDPVTFTFTVSNPPPPSGFPGFAGGVRVASGDVNAVEMGDGYAGSHVLYQDVFVPTLETGPAVAMETVTIAHEGLLI